MSHSKCTSYSNKNLFFLLSFLFHYFLVHNMSPRKLTFVIIKLTTRDIKPFRFKNRYDVIERHIELIWSRFLVKIQTLMISTSIHFILNSDKLLKQIHLKIYTEFVSSCFCSTWQKKFNTWTAQWIYISIVLVISLLNEVDNFSFSLFRYSSTYSNEQAFYFYDLRRLEMWFSEFSKNDRNGL